MVQRMRFLIICYDITIVAWSRIVILFFIPVFQTFSLVSLFVTSIELRADKEDRTVVWARRLHPPPPTWMIILYRIRLFLRTYIRIYVGTYVYTFDGRNPICLSFAYIQRIRLLSIVYNSSTFYAYSHGVCRSISNIYRMFIGLPIS